MSFKILVETGVFPPRGVANSFFACGYDDLPDENVLEWEPFQLSEDEYIQFFTWWRSRHKTARVDSLGLSNSDFSGWFTRAIDVNAT